MHLYIYICFYNAKYEYNLMTIEYMISLSISLLLMKPNRNHYGIKFNFQLFHNEIAKYHVVCSATRFNKICKSNFMLALGKTRVPSCLLTVIMSEMPPNIYTLAVRLTHFKENQFLHTKHHSLYTFKAFQCLLDVKKKLHMKMIVFYQ